MINPVSITLQAMPVPYMASMDFLYSDLAPALLDYWNNSLECLDKDQKEEEEKHKNWMSIYGKVLFPVLVEAVSKSHGQSVIFWKNVVAQYQQGVVKAQGMFFFEPKMVWPTKGGMKLKNLLDQFLSSTPFPEESIDARIEQFRNELRFNPKKVRFYTDNITFKEGDVFDALIFHKIDGKTSPAVKTVIALTDTCPANLKQVILGKCLGEVIVYEEPDDSGGVIEITVRPMNKLDAALISDDDLCQSQGVLDMAALRLNIRRQAENNLQTKIMENLLIYTRNNVEKEPLSGEFVNEWAEGHYSGLLTKQKEVQVLRSMGVRSKAEAMQTIVQSLVDEYFLSRTCREICQIYDMLPTEEELREHAKRISTGLSYDNRYLVTLDFCKQRAEHYLKTKGESKEFFSSLLIVSN